MAVWDSALSSPPSTRLSASREVQKNNSRQHEVSAFSIPRLRIERWWVIEKACQPCVRRAGRESPGEPFILPGNNVAEKSSGIAERLALIQKCCMKARARRQGMEQKVFTVPIPRSAWQLQNRRPVEIDNQSGSFCRENTYR